MIFYLLSLIFAADVRNIYEDSTESDNMLKCEDISKCLKDIVVTIRQSGCTHENGIKLRTTKNGKIIIKKEDGSIFLICDKEIKEGIYREILGNFKRECEVTSENDNMFLFRPWLIEHCPFFEEDEELEIINLNNEETMEAHHDDNELSSNKKESADYNETTKKWENVDYLDTGIFDKINSENMTDKYSKDSDDVIEYDSTANPDDNLKIELLSDNPVNVISNFSEVDFSTENLTDNPVNISRNVISKINEVEFSTEKLSDNPVNVISNFSEVELLNENLTDNPVNVISNFSEVDFSIEKLTDNPVNISRNVISKINEVEFSTENLTDNPVNVISNFSEVELLNENLTDNPVNVLSDLSKVDFSTFMDNYTTSESYLALENTEPNYIVNSNEYGMSLLSYGPIIAVCALVIAGLGYFYKKKRSGNVIKEEYEEVAVVDTAV